MSEDKEGKNELPIEGLSPKRKELVDGGFSEGRKLYGDLFNIWGHLAFVTSAEELHSIKLLEHYKQFMEQNRYPQAEVDYVMQLSDPTAVAEFDRLVDEFNADLERIKQEGDVGKVREFTKRASELVYRKS